MRFTALKIDIVPSYGIGVWILCCASIALIVSYHLSLNVWSKGVLIALLSCYTIYIYMRDACRLLPFSWIRAQQLTGNEWLLVNNRNQPCAGTLRADTFVSSWLVVLRFNRIGTLPHVPKIMSVTLLRSDLPAETWRELNIYLRWQAQRYLEKNTSSW